MFSKKLSRVHYFPPLPIPVSCPTAYGRAHSLQRASALFFAYQPQLLRDITQFNPILVPPTNNFYKALEITPPEVKSRAGWYIYIYTLSCCLQILLKDHKHSGSLPQRHGCSHVVTRSFAALTARWETLVLPPPVLVTHSTPVRCDIPCVCVTMHTVANTWASFLMWEYE